MCKRIIIFLLIFIMLLSGCKSKDNSFEQMSVTDKTTASLVTIDGKQVNVGGSVNDRKVGIFYFNWLGQHANEQSDIFDVSKLLKSNPQALKSLNDDSSPLYQYHFWGEPLYGYYNSTDEYVIYKHIEMFIAVGIDFVAFDATNGVVYTEAYNAFFKVWNNFYSQGLNPPKIMFITNSSSKQTVEKLYDDYYTNSKYDKMWFCQDGKPLVVTDKSNFDKTDEKVAKIINRLTLRPVQWPSNEPVKVTFPWISFDYPQFNHNGVMSVSPAQHTAGKMSLTSQNRGRGFNYQTETNEESGIANCLNYNAQWENAINNDSVDTVFITGWNEWMALKFPPEKDNEDVYFVDQYNYEYSRDIEPSKEYGDDYYLQTLINIKKFKYSGAQKSKGAKTSVKISDDIETLAKQSNASIVYDALGDDIVRNCAAAAGTLKYENSGNEIDFTKLFLANDSKNLYVLIEYYNDENNILKLKLKSGNDNFVIDVLGNVRKNGVIAGKVEIANLTNSENGNKKILFTIPITTFTNKKEIAVKAYEGNFDKKGLDFYQQGDCIPSANFYYNYIFA